MDQQPTEQQEARGAATDAAPTPPPGAPGATKTAIKVVKPEVLSSSPKMRHTRSCNGREVCNCMLRLESALFHKNLLEKAIKKRCAPVEAPALEQDRPNDAEEEEKAPAEAPVEPPRRVSLRARTPSVRMVESEQGLPTTAKRVLKKQKTEKQTKKQQQQQQYQKKKAAVVKRYVAVAKLCHFDFDMKLLIASFLPPIPLARLGMTNRKWRDDVDRMAQLSASTFLKAAARTDRLLKDEKAEGDSWSRFIHMQLSCVFKVFVYYTGYKTGQMRKDFAHWAFGVVEFDPNEPHRTILPNSWKFLGHEPWMTQRGNGKMGEWHLRNKYKAHRAPKRFREEVKEWAMALRPGSFLAVSYQNAGSEEPAWWEAQVWYTWRQDGNHDPAIVYDAETDTRYEVAPDNLAEHFQSHPLHVVDVTTTPTRLCGACSTRGRSFKYCHIDKGHPML